MGLGSIGKGLSAFKSKSSKGLGSIGKGLGGKKFSKPKSTSTILKGNKSEGSTPGTKIMK